ncbi:sulfotransferase (plasmid) [Rhodobacteraceae bacterium SC52]|nr:sulfotransferase [Rhodobacteraceae bacterium SC52]
MSDYSTLDKLLHRVVLGSPALSEMLGDMDGAAAGKSVAPARAPVYVTGLARAGTTVLMRALHGSDQFASLTYADMPMVMAPNLWAKLSRSSRKEGEARERAHGDGVMVDFDAPEALEEVFWRTHCGRDYIRPDGLVPHVPDAETLEAYRTYQARICHRYSRPRYLAKNNNMMLRLLPLARALPEARFLIPVRDPLAQAQSLRSQHARFQDSDAFTRSYMTWLVHHEFGADQRPFLLPGQTAPEGPLDGLDYWLTEWIACYGYLADMIDTARAEGLEALLPVIYERLGSDPAAWPKVAAFAGVDPSADPGFRPATPPESDPQADADLVARARALYDRLVAQADL